ncbi:hypothetical protein D9758_018950 [Tetrapyrgos nigripes]|uniref:Cytochrome P450 n=1 Tax=Tetrapyrgos nigripes TaxID=182062 RepID=A0A8H5AUS2_9AGAR|nr:hypothetical protein D9758_018950 [Tetrapyrgos nigripes]
MLNIPYLLAIPVLLVIYNLCGYLLRRPRQTLSYPPGPRGLPIIGSFFDVLTPRTGLDAQWAIYRDMGTMYHSDVFHINILGDHTVVVNSAKAAEELLERRSGIYSSSLQCTWLMNRGEFDISSRNVYKANAFAFSL